MELGRTIRENRATIICGIVVAAVLAAAFLARSFAPGTPDGSLVALVHDGDGQTHELPLSTDTQYTVTTSLGTNTVVVEDGAIRMLDADCPNRTCLLAHPLAGPGAQIICLPHQLWIEVVSEGEAGGSMDVTLAENIDADADVDLVAR